MTAAKRKPVSKGRKKATASASRVKKGRPIPDEAFLPHNAVPWCRALPGMLQCLICGSSIRIGGTMVVDGVEKKRAYAPHRWLNKHRTECAKVGEETK